MVGQPLPLQGSQYYDYHHNEDNYDRRWSHPIPPESVALQRRRMSS